MFEETIKSFQEKWVKFSSNLLNELKEEYDKFWKELIEDLSKKKIALEDEVGGLQKSKDKLIGEIGTLSQKVISLNGGIKMNEDNLRKYEAKTKEMLDKIISIEQREGAVDLREKTIKAKEDEFIIKESVFQRDVRTFDERQRKFKQYFKDA